MLVRRQLDLNFAGNCLGHLNLECQDVMPVPLVGLGPKVRFVADPDELRRNPYPITGTPDASLKHVGNPEVLADLMNGLGRGFVAHRRSPGDYTQALRAEPGKLGDHIFS
ncbi:hypothetical protein [Ralstonia pseudosolanacearum]|uniref:hypothetical protein n=1 Tax=Ralstonia pseudosolanacearum TaxID=1310165 RepID=UPI00083CEB19|nr:hypothetical protein [Ralstonia pseudosolanacearum]UYR02386.1 hypothetical protein NQS37_02790 [Ralstonia pseudosolanacearum]UYR11648.1 hypothetical protein NQS35_15535 [Ralstonia pseudosolanacearum]